MVIMQQLLDWPMAIVPPHGESGICVFGLTFSREALSDSDSYPGGRWQLCHLKGTELVADGMTKPLAGPSFFGFLSDLGVRHEEAAACVRRVTMGDRHLQVHDRSVALQALIVGGAMVQAAQSAEAQGAFDPSTPCGRAA